MFGKHTQESNLGPRSCEPTTTCDGAPGCQVVEDLSDIIRLRFLPDSDPICTEFSAIVLHLTTSGYRRIGKDGRPKGLTANLEVRAYVT